MPKVTKATKATVVLLVVDSTGVLADVLPARAEPDSNVAFVLINQTGDKYDLKIDFDDIFEKSDGTKTPKNPFNDGGAKHKELKPGEIDLIQQTVRRPGDFGGASLPYTTYKYTVILKNITTGVTQPPYDPDIDVPPA